ncbi:MAG: nuclear transport factor 2 family protein [Hyphomicrobiales bacterium]|nr:nuclear transport factor 2 family protein [Hyphomicrobiales bacterium]
MAELEMQEHPVLRAERAALERWCRGDPSGFLEISADDVGYFEPFLWQRIDGRAALATHYEALRGQVKVRSFEILDPRIVESGEMVLLSYRFRSTGETGVATHWQASEVYRLGPQGPRIVHTHWSLPQSDAE